MLDDEPEQAPKTKKVHKPLFGGFDIGNKDDADDEDDATGTIIKRTPALARKQTLGFGSILDKQDKVDIMQS
jgi:hypothetical protein